MNETLKNGASGLSHRVLISGRRPVRVATIHDEEWIEGEPVADPESLVRSLREVAQADIFSFARPLPACEPYYPFHFVWDNVAAAKLTEFAKWWESLPQESRKNVRRSQRRGVIVSRVSFDDQFVRGIGNIYNETPIRQGRKFWHYGKSFGQIKAANATYLDRSEFIGAFFGDDLIGFIKFVMVNNVARIMQILSMEAHTDKRPTNALLAKAVEICCEKRATHLVYGKYVYGRKETSPVTEFKRRNGFERLNFPRYYIPLTRLGAFALRCGLHRGIAQFVPANITNVFLAARAALYRRHFRLQDELQTTTHIGRNSPVGSSSTPV
jgi:hypothetical protein